MIAYISSGYKSDTWVISTGCSDTATSGGNEYYSDTAIYHDWYTYVAKAEIAEIAEPWKVPNHYPPAPLKLEYKSKAPRFISKKYKQPVSRSGFKRGQRYEKI